MYVFVRKDLSHAQQVVQAGHALVEASRNHLVNKPFHPNVIVFGVKSEAKLAQLADRIDSSGVPICRFREPDIGDQLTAFATAPVFGETRELFRKFQLL